jgi:CPA2 family monovalent cation:H+ antiporter-2
LLLQDVLIIFFISALSLVDQGISGLVLALGGVAGLVMLAWVWLRWVAPFLLLRLQLDEESQLLVVLANLFLFLGLAHLLKQPLVAGAFLAGVSLSAFPLGGIVRGQMNSLFDFFLALFFVTLGATLEVPRLEDLALAGALILLVLLSTPILVIMIARGAGLSARTGIEGGLLLAQCSEFSLVLAVVGVGQGHISSSLLGVVALVTVVTMILTPFVATDAMTWRLLRWHPFGRRIRLDSRPRDHVLLLGCGPNTMQLLEELIAHGQHVVVVDDDSVVVEQLCRQGVEAVCGEGADYAVLRVVGVRRARVIISTMRRVQDSERVILFSRGRKVIVRVFAPEEATRVEAVGGVPVLYSAVAAEDFLRWFDSEFNPERRALLAG